MFVRMLDYRPLCLLTAVGLTALGWTNSVAGRAPDPPEPAAAEIAVITPDEASAVLAKTLRIRLAPDLGALSDDERAALEELLAAGRILHALYQEQLHPEAAAIEARLAAGESLRADIPAASLADLFYLSKGPIVTTLDNRRVGLVPTPPERNGKTLYPADADRGQLDALADDDPVLAAGLAAARQVVRRATHSNLDADLARLDAHPLVAGLNPELRDVLESREADPGAFYAVPYALAYAERLAAVRTHIDRAAARSAAESADFAAYLRQRSRDLLTGDYEAGDAAWVRGEFGNLNAQLGSYETYNDALYGTKAFYSASILIRDVDRSNALEAVVGNLQAIEDSLPYDGRRTVDNRIPVGVYNVIADYGQARGTNTATILPNDANHVRKYGRTILVRNNILGNTELFAIRRARFDSVVAADFRADLTLDGGFNRTLWHEIGHYLGVATTADGRSLDSALGDLADLLEELKADLVSLHAAPLLADGAYYDAGGLRAHYADGIRRTLQVVRPRPTQPYQNMQLIQFNYFVEKAVLVPDDSGRLTIDYEQYPGVVDELLAQVLNLQSDGDYAMAAEFVDRWNYWDDRLHGTLATRMQGAAQWRRVIVDYAADPG